MRMKRKSITTNSMAKVTEKRIVGRMIAKKTISRKLIPENWETDGPIAPKVRKRMQGTWAEF